MKNTTAKIIRLIAVLGILAAASGALAGSAGADGTAASAASGGDAYSPSANLNARCGLGKAQTFALDITNLQPASGYARQHVALKVWTWKSGEYASGQWYVFEAPAAGPITLEETRAPGNHYIGVESYVWTGSRWEGQKYSWYKPNDQWVTCKVHSLEEIEGLNILYYDWLYRGGLASLAI